MISYPIPVLPNNGSPNQYIHVVVISCVTWIEFRVSEIWVKFWVENWSLEYSNFTGIVSSNVEHYYIVVGLQQQFAFIASVALHVWYLYCWMFVSYILYLLVSSYMSFYHHCHCRHRRIKKTSLFKMVYLDNSGSITQLKSIRW